MIENFEVVLRISDSGQPFLVIEKNKIKFVFSCSFYCHHFFSLLKLYPEKFMFDNTYFYNLTGDEELRDMLLMNRKPSGIK